MMTTDATQCKTNTNKLINSTKYVQYSKQGTSTKEHLVLASFFFVSILKLCAEGIRNVSHSIYKQNNRKQQYINKNNQKIKE